MGRGEEVCRLRVGFDLHRGLADVLDEEGFNFILQFGEDAVDDLLHCIRCRRTDEFEHQWVDFGEVGVGQEGCEVLSMGVFDGRRARRRQMRRVQRGQKVHDQCRLGQRVCLLRG